MIKYTILFALAFFTGLVWMFSDAPSVTMSESSETAKVSSVASRQLNQPVLPANTSRGVAEQPAAEHVVAPVGEQAIASTTEQTVATMQSTAEPFTADDPYLAPAQRSNGNLGGPPPRSMMLMNPQDAH